MSPDPQPEPVTRESRDAVIDDLRLRAAAAKLAFEQKPADFADDDLEDEAVRVTFPAGREARRVTVYGSGIEELASLPFERYHFIGDYDAIIDVTTGEIEALVEAGGRAIGRVSPRLWRLPGVAILDDESRSDDDSGDDIEEEVRVLRKPERWILAMRNGDREIEFSPPSLMLRLLRSRRFTAESLKMRGFSTASQDDALTLLERYANNLFFDLDLRYGMHLSLARRRQLQRAEGARPVEHPPNFPSNVYEPAPLELYRYGRSAVGLPLLQYLAYYQSLEYFFPAFAREEAIRRIRSEVTHPRFSPDNERSLTRLIALTLESSSGVMRERDQLRQTVRGCIDDSALEKLVLDLDTQHRQHFTRKQQALKGVRPLRTSGGEDIRDQVADRIYAIRCRIVHTKQDGGAPGVELLLPTSAEANELGGDVQLVREIAQLALVARSTRESASS